MDLNHFYTNRKNEFNKTCEALKKSIQKIAWVRTGVALLFFYVIYLAFSNTNYWYALLPVIVLFIFLVSWHGKIQTRYNLYHNLEKLNQLELEVLDNNYSEFNDGKAFVNPHHAYSYDLDLFGAGSLFQFLNRCGTAIGEKKLAEDLMMAQPTTESIKKRQEAVKELAQDVEFRQWFWAQGHLLHDSTLENEGLFSWLKEPDVLLGKTVYRVLLVLFPAISVALIGLIIYDTSYFPLLFLFGGVQWIFVSFKSKEVDKAERALSHHKVLFDKYAQLMQKIADAKFTGTHLLEIQAEARDASVRIRQFSQLVNAFEARKNGIAAMFGNSLYLYDLQCLYRLEKWRSLNKLMVRGWLDKIAEVDALNSLGTFHFNNSDNFFPVLHDDLSIQSEEMGHPLIASKGRVNNSFKMGPENIMLITGANMAGKSTFLRTAGVNLILALSGSSVCAKYFACPLISLHTSMRATDSLVDHQSYFYAELSRLKGIMEEVRDDKPMLVLLDEILRGTNSKDKQEGSIGLLNQFVAHDVLLMLASHDVVLGELEKKYPSAIRNYCFESEIENNELTFDYTLHQGVANKANATFLMQQMGILPKA
jgi:ABC-type multidrug transport system fused ATPase/permease subunit